MIQSLVVHVVFVVLKTTTNFVLQYRKTTNTNYTTSDSL